MSWSVTALIVIAIAIGLFELPKLFKSGDRKEAWVSTGFIITGTMLCMLHIYDFPLPNPSSIIMTVLQPISDGMNRLFE